MRGRGCRGLNPVTSTRKATTVAMVVGSRGEFPLRGVPGVCWLVGRARALVPASADCSPVQVPRGQLASQMVRLGTALVAQGEGLCDTIYGE